jgi:hypothetical protein
MLGTLGSVLFVLFVAGMAAILVLIVLALRVVITRGKTPRSAPPSSTPSPRSTGG